MLALLRSPPAACTLRSTLKASRTMKPAMTALVVAMAWMIRPAIPLISHRDWSGMWKVAQRRLAAAATKSIASSSSLSKASEPTSDARWVKIRSTEARSTAALSSTDHARCSSRAVAAASGSASFASSTLTGGLRFSHRTSMLSSRCTSSSKTALKTRRAKSAPLSPSCCFSGGGGGGAAAAPSPSGGPPSASPSAPSSAVSTRSVSSPPKSFLKSSSLAQLMQCTGFSGWLRMVQIGKVFCTRGGSHSKHFVLPLTMARTWPTYPSVPLSMSGMPTLRQSRFTCRRASTLSRAFSTMLNVLKKSGPNCSVSLMSPRCASMERLAACGNARTAFLATFALDSLTSAARKRNWRLRLE
mmetsp:Transcript_33974/g.103941  ORF Transcript_33974/g.103941 Transcript_33974/m.103941 type:complete len:357 (-) Transcript_33974:190-1260(-)